MTTRSTSKDAGKQAFSQGKYPEALSLYSQALDQLTNDGQNNDDSSNGNDSNSGRNTNDANERHILLSNVIACRLKIGGDNMIANVVDDSKEVSADFIFLNLFLFACIVRCVFLFYVLSFYLIL